MQIYRHKDIGIYTFAFFPIDSELLEGKDYILSYFPSLEPAQCLELGRESETVN